MADGGMVTVLPVRAVGDMALAIRDNGVDECECR